MANNSDTLNSNVGDNKAQYVSSLSFQKVDIEHNDCVKTNSDDTNTQEDGLAYVSDPVAERKLLRKLDLWILPVLCLIYFIASMDRGDIGNAQVAGMQADLHISNTNWPQVTSMFYIGYIVCQPLGTFLLRKLTPPVILGCAVTFWGTVTVLLLTVKTYQQAIGLRVLIGAAEGFVQAAPFYMSIWYKQYELGFRGGVVFSVSTLAGAFNGLISYGTYLYYCDRRSRIKLLRILFYHRCNSQLLR
jgi:MFS family permease